MKTVLQTPLNATTFPVIEVFGPTIQGEGAEAGRPCHFVRLGGCDYRCSWCDTMYAVDPAEVRRNSEHLSREEIVGRIDRLQGSPGWVVLSGGNPALHQLDELVASLQMSGYRVAVETQGSLWRDWLERVDRLTISPKPPSSGMDTAPHRKKLDSFMEQVTKSALGSSVLKIVCFDETDLRWAKAIARQWASIPLYLSAGTPVPSPSDLTAPLRPGTGGSANRSRMILSSLRRVSSRSCT